MIMSTILAAKQTMDSAKNKFNDAVDKFEDVKNKMAKLNFKRIKGIAVTLTVINLVISCAALAVAIVALVKSCKAKNACCEGYDCGWDDDCGDYNFSLDDDDIRTADGDVSADEEDEIPEELKF